MPAKRALSAALALLLAVSFAAPSGARALSDAGFQYTVSSGAATVTGCANTCPTTLVIPDTLDGYSVTTIGSDAFNSHDLTSVTIPDSVTTIGYAAFADSRLTTVTIGNLVTTIGDYAFYYNRLTTVTIPDSVTTIGSLAFRGNALISVTIGNSVTTIGDAAFYGNALTTVTIPDSVTSIRGFAFQDNALTSVTIPDSVTTIGYAAFSYNQLTSVTFLGNAPTDGGSVFGENAGLSYLLRASNATGWGATWSEMQVNTYKSSLTGLFTARANASAAGATVTYAAAGTTVALDSTGQAGGGTITYTESDADCSISGSTLTVVQVGDGSCVVTATIAASDDYLEATDTVTITINKASLTGLFTARANASAAGATVTYTAAGATVALDSTGQTGGGTITYSESDADCSISGSTLTVVQVGDGSCLVTATIAASDDYLEATDTVTITIISANVRASATVKPVISGTAAVNMTLTAAKGIWTGYPTPTFTYQWYACTSAVTITQSTVPSTCVSISGATRSTFKPTSTQRGKYVAVLVTGRSTGTTATAWLSKTTTSIGVRASATVKPAISGTAAVNMTLTAAKGIWTGYPTPTFTYQWYACTSAVTITQSTVPSTCVSISGATRSTFKLTTAQRGKYVAVLVTGTSLRTTATAWLSKTTAKVR